MSDSVCVFVPWLGPTLNKIWAGKHWGARKRIADQAHKACLVARHVPPFDVPVALIFEPIHSKGRRRLDCTNYAISAKSIEDGLVRLGVLPGDSFAEVVGVEIRQPQRGPETGMYVTIQPQHKEERQ